jgi:hypothetical protein
MQGSAMTENELRIIERDLQLQLPEAYRNLILQFPEELRDWPPRGPEAPGDRRDDFFLDAAQLIAANEKARKRYRKRLPAGAFVFGGDNKDSWFIECGEPNPPVQLINKDYILGGTENLQEHLESVRQSHQEAWKKAGKLRKAGAKATLAPDELIAAGQELARPAVALYDTGKQYAAVWRGSGVVSPGPGQWRHWISLDAGHLPDNPRKLRGVISVYDWIGSGDRFSEVKVVHDEHASLPKKTDGTKLYAKEFQCLPDVDAVFQFGSKKIKDWLKATSWDGNTDYKKTPVKEYLKLVHAQHPFSANDGAFALLGGWSWCFNWCYSTDEEYPWHLFKKALIVLTLAESEPWIEVFDDGKKFVAFSRIT